MPTFRAMPADEVKRRIEAARTLRGITQAELGRLLHEEDGFGKHDLGRLERGLLPLRPKYIDALVRHLHVPADWFTAPTVDDVVGWTQPEPPAVTPTDEQLRAAAELLAPQLLAAAQALAQERAREQPSTGAPDRPPRATGADGG